MRLFERNIFSLKLSLYLLSFLSCIDSRGLAFWSIFWLWSMVLLAYLLDDSLMWADFQVYIKDASFREEHFCHWNFRSISSHSWVVLILVRKPLEYFLIMIHGPSSLFIGRLVDVSWFSSLYKRCVFSRGTFLSLKLSLYLLSFLSCIDSREKAFGVFLIMIHGPSSLFIGRLVDVSWFSSLYKRCVFSRGTFLSWNFRSISSHSWVVLILVRKTLEYFLIMIHGPSSLFIGRLVDVSRFSSSYKDASLREEHFCHWNFRSISSHSWVVLILVRKPLEYFLIMIHGPSSLFIGRLVDVSRFSSLYKRCVFSRGTFLSLKLSLYLFSFLSCIDSREKAFGVFFWLWSMVLLAYLLDDSLMWADFQVYIKDASFREEHFCHWNFRSISSHSWVVLILVRKPFGVFFWLWSMVLLAYLLDVRWCELIFKFI